MREKERISTTKQTKKSQREIQLNELGPFSSGSICFFKSINAQEMDFCIYAWLVDKYIYISSYSDQIFKLWRIIEKEKKTELNYEMKWRNRWRWKEKVKQMAHVCFTFFRHKMLKIVIKQIVNQCNRGTCQRLSRYQIFRFSSENLCFFSD